MLVFQIQTVLNVSMASTCHQVHVSHVPLYPRDVVFVTLLFVWHAAMSMVTISTRLPVQVATQLCLDVKYALLVMYVLNVIVAML